MSWPKYLLGMLGVVIGLIVVEQINPSLAVPYVLLILLSVALAHPTFFAELRAALLPGAPPKRT